MNRLRFIALALCAVMALGLICGCNDTKPAGTVSDGASSEDSILDKTGKLTDEEAKIIAADRLTKYNDLVQFLTADCYEKYTDKSKKVTVSPYEYYKVTNDGKYDFKSTSDISLYVSAKIGSSYFFKKMYNLCSDTNCFPFELTTDSGNTLYSSGGLRPVFATINDELYMTEPTESFDERFDVENIIIGEKSDKVFSADVPIIDKASGKAIRTDTVIFEQYNMNRYAIGTVIEGGAQLSKKLSESEVGSLISELVGKYNSFDRFSLSACYGDCTNNEVLPNSNESYKIVVAKDEYNILSRSDFQKYAESIFDKVSAESMINTYVHPGDCPISFTDADGKTLLTAEHDIIRTRFVEYNGRLYAGPATASNDSKFSSDGYEILFSTDNYFIAKLKIVRLSGDDEGMTQIVPFALTEDGYRISQL